MVEQEHWFTITEIKLVTATPQVPEVIFAMCFNWSEGLKMLKDQFTSSVNHNAHTADFPKFTMNCLPNMKCHNIETIASEEGKFFKKRWQIFETKEELKGKYISDYNLIRW